MKLPLERLDRSLEGELAPLYWLSGDEPLLLQEAAAAVRDAARAGGFGEREVFDVEARFKFDNVLFAANSMSLFTEQKLIELRFQSGRITKEGAEAISKYIDDPADGNLLLVTSPKLDGRIERAAWFKSMVAFGVWVPIYPVTLDRLPKWLGERCRKAGVKLDAEAFELLLERVEGNLLAAAQEIERLKILDPEATWTRERLLEATEDASRYTIYQLIDHALEGDARRVTRMLYALRMEGSEPIAINGALMRELRSLLKMSNEIDGGRVESVLQAHRVWASRKRAVSRALARLSSDALEDLLEGSLLVDRASKGMDKADPWQELGHIFLTLAGHRSIPSAAAPT
jgi:DNA polymerase-3 subunit delta